VRASTHRAFVLSRRYEEAITESRKSLELDPDYWLALWFQGQALEQLGRYAEALPPLKKGHMALADNPSVLVAEEARVYALSGRRADALRTLDQLMAMSKHTQVSKYAIASVYMALGDKDQAFARLNQACAERSVNLEFLKVAPELDVLRSDTRFQDLVRKLNLP